MQGPEAHILSDLILVSLCRSLNWIGKIWVRLGIDPCLAFLKVAFIVRVLTHHRTNIIHQLNCESHNTGITLHTSDLHFIHTSIHIFQEFSE